MVTTNETRSSGDPLVTVVTPFYNTADFLAECIESVLRQTYTNWEYVLLDNCSSDGSRDIALSYAKKDPRIKVQIAAEFVGQVANYNRALELVSPNSVYCKVVQADDWILPDCLSQMVRLAMSDESIALVGSYSLYGEHVGHDCLPWSPRTVLPGREAVRRMLLSDDGFLGSPTTVLYRSDLVRAQRPFYRLDSPCEDIDACFNVLDKGKFGFVHEILSFNRRDNESIWTRIERFSPVLLNNLILLYRYGRQYLREEELLQRRDTLERRYYGFLARALFRRDRKDLWQFHARTLAECGYQIDRRRVAKCALGLLASRVTSLD